MDQEIRFCTAADGTRLACATSGDGMPLVGPARAGVYIHLMPLFGALPGFALLGESLLPYHAAGAALVFTGIVFAQYGRRSASPRLSESRAVQGGYAMDRQG